MAGYTRSSTDTAELRFSGPSESGAPYNPGRAATAGNAPAEVWSTRTSTASQQPLQRSGWPGAGGPGRMAASGASASEICAWSTSSSTSAHSVRPRLRAPKWAPPSSSPGGPHRGWLWRNPRARAPRWSCSAAWTPRGRRRCEGSMRAACSSHLGASGADRWRPAPCEQRTRVISNTMEPRGARCTDSGETLSLWGRDSTCCMYLHATCYSTRLRISSRLSTGT